MNTPGGYVGGNGGAYATGSGRGGIGGTSGSPSDDSSDDCDECGINLTAEGDSLAALGDCSGLPVGVVAAEEPALLPESSSSFARTFSRVGSTFTFGLL